MLGTRHSILGSVAILATLASAAFAGTVEGSATYRERIALPPDATLFVELQDVSLVDAPAVTLAAQRYAFGGVPAGFELTYDDTLIQDNHSYRQGFDHAGSKPAVHHGYGLSGAHERGGELC